MPIKVRNAAGRPQLKVTMILFERLRRSGVSSQPRVGCMTLAGMSGNGARKATKAVARVLAEIGAFYAAVHGPPATAPNYNPPIATSSIAMIAMSFTDSAACSRRKLTTLRNRVEATNEVHRWISWNLRSGVDCCGDPALGSTGVGPGKYLAGGFCRCAGAELAAITALQYFVDSAGHIRDPAHHRRALHLRENATRDLVERFLPSLAQSLRSFAHGAFGFLLAFPIRELLLRFSGIRRGIWSLALPVAIILAVSGCFEIVESIVAQIVAPGKGVDWLGGQGDEWDAQNDIVSALVGSLLMMGVVAALPERKT